MLRRFAFMMVASLAFGGATGNGARAGYGECYERAPYASYSRTMRRRVQEWPGVYSIERTPPHYATRTRRIVIAPAVSHWRREPGLYRTVAVKRRVGGGWGWERQRHGGKWVMCKVRRPVRTVLTERKVLVRRGRAFVVRRPAVVETVSDRILIKPYRNFARYRPAYTYDVYERAHIQLEGTRWKRYNPRGC